MNVILIGIVAMVAIIWLVPAIPVNPIGALIIVIFGFFFATVSSRMVGLVGSSNNPVSGMAIATLLIATMVIKASGNTGIDGMKAAIAIGSVICIVAAIAGDTSQDLKTGYLLGATPKKQQIGELIGVVAAGLAIGGVLYLLNTAWGYGSAEVPAPQATLMKMIVEGIMGGKLPWTLVFIGVFLAIGLEILRIPVMPFAIGLYLPIYLNAAIMIGGVVRMFVDGRKNVDDKKKEEYNNVSGISGIFKSFGDSPDGFKGELQEVMVSIGAEYSYNEQFFLRGGYFYENANKGNRQYFSVGAGFRMSVFQLDAAYLVSTVQSNPLDQTLRFSLSFDMDGIKNLFR